MTEKPGPTSLDEIGRRLDKAREAQERKRPKAGGSSGKAMGVAFRISMELVLGVCIGAFIGWQIDKWVGTTPLFLLIFFLLGFAAGLRNVFRVAGQMQTPAEDKDLPDAGPATDEMDEKEQDGQS